MMGEIAGMGVATRRFSDGARVGVGRLHGTCGDCGFLRLGPREPVRIGTLHRLLEEGWICRVPHRSRRASTTCGPPPAVRGLRVAGSRAGLRLGLYMASEQPLTWRFNWARKTSPPGASSWVRRGTVGPPARRLPRLIRCCARWSSSEPDSPQHAGRRQRVSRRSGAYSDSPRGGSPDVGRSESGALVFANRVR